MKFSFNNTYFKPIHKNEKINIGNFLFYNLIFNSLNDINNGGAMNLKNNNLIILIENCFFNNCSSNNKGGAIYYESNDGQFYMYQSCFQYCYTNNIGIENNGQFSNLNTNNLNPIYLEDISIIFCSPFKFFDKYDSMIINYGQNNLTNINSSNNKVSRFSSYVTLNSKSTLKFINLFNNTSEWQACIGTAFHYFHVSFVNMIACISPEYGLIHYNGDHFIYSGFKFIMKYCIFHNNTGKIIDLCCNGNLFFSDSILDYYNNNRLIPQTENISIGIVFTYKFNDFFCLNTEITYYNSININSISKFLFIFLIILD